MRHYRLEGHRHLPLAQPLQRVLVCFSHLRWNFVYQRPQHLLSRAAKDRHVFFIEEPVYESGAPQYRQEVRNGVTVTVPVLPPGTKEAEAAAMQRQLLDELLASLPPSHLAFWYYTPMALTFSGHMAADLTIYDCMDELSAFKGAPPRLMALEADLFARADLVFTGGRSLYDAKRGRHPRTHLFPSSIDKAHFAQARARAEREPEDQSALPKPRIGFFGVVDERMDMDLVAGLARLRPDWQFVMLGPVVKIDPAGLPRLPNIHWLGPKSYDDLPRYLAGWDLGFMPFALNESTRFISPTKTPEFLAAGLPLTSTPIADVMRPYGEKGLVEIAATAQEMAEKLEMLMRRPKAEWLAAIEEHLRGMSWDGTWAAMSELMDEAVPAREAGHV